MPSAAVTPRMKTSMATIDVHSRPDNGTVGLQSDLPSGKSHPTGVAHDPLGERLRMLKARIRRVPHPCRSQNVLIDHRFQASTQKALTIPCRANPTVRFRPNGRILRHLANHLKMAANSSTNRFPPRFSRCTREGTEPIDSMLSQLPDVVRQELAQQPQRQNDCEGCNSDHLNGDLLGPCQRSVQVVTERQEPADVLGDSSNCAHVAISIP